MLKLIVSFCKLKYKGVYRLLSNTDWNNSIVCKAWTNNWVITKSLTSGIWDAYLTLLTN